MPERVEKSDVIGKQLRVDIRYEENIEDVRINLKNHDKPKPTKNSKASKHKQASKKL